MLIVDAHQDIAYNILTYGRDYTLSAEAIRGLERGTEIPAHNGDTLLGWPEYQRGQVAVIFATLFAAPERLRESGWTTRSYSNPDEAYAEYKNQVEAYYRLTDNHPDHFQLVDSLASLKAVLSRWEQTPNPVPPEASESQEEDNQGSAGGFEEPGETPAWGNPVGMVILMEGAEGIRSPSELEEWWKMGVRVIGPAWAGNRFCGGTREPGPLTREGFALLEGMGGLGFALDLSHMDEQAVLQALDFYPGLIIASHSNAMALVKGMETNRLLSDRVIHGILSREGVIGVVPYNRFLKSGWNIADGRQAVSLHSVVAQIDYICQMAGDANHVGLGSDYDGGFGWQSVPAEVDTIADLQKLVPQLAEIGYSQQDIANIMGQNWLTQLRRILPEGT